MEKKTPFEAWHGIKPPVKNMRFSYVSQVKRDKLDKKTEPGVFIGYSSISKAYRIFQSQSGKIIVSRDVKFLEDEQWDWNEDSRVLNKNSKLHYDELVDDQPIR